MAEMILVVDDDKDVRFVAQQGLLARGYAVLETGDPQQAIRMAKDQTIHLLGRPRILAPFRQKPSRHAGCLLSRTRRGCLMVDNHERDL
jgi:CheY-like chemotaxis protein